MASKKVDLHVKIVRFVMDHQPPIVACESVDAGGGQHTVIDKVWVFCEHTLDGESKYPQPGAIRCTIMAEWRDDAGRELCKINTADPFHIESTEGLAEFVVLRHQVSTAEQRVNLR
jgi:hypothetical protein